MKKLVLTLIMLAALTATYAQKGNHHRAASSPVLSVVDNQYVYAGVESRLALGVYNVDPEDMELIVTKGEAKLIRETPNGISYKIMAPKPGEVVLGVRDRKRHTMVSTINLRVVPMPTPVLNWGKVASGNLLPLSKAAQLAFVAQVPNSTGANIPSMRVDQITLMVVGSGMPAITLKGSKLNEETVALLRRELKEITRRDKSQVLRLYVEASVMGADNHVYQLSGCYRLVEELQPMNQPERSIDPRQKAFQVSDRKEMPRAGKVGPMVNNKKADVEKDKDAPKSDTKSDDKKSNTKNNKKK